MTIQKALPGIDGTTMMALAQSGTLAEASKVRKAAIRALSELNPAGLVALALSLSPDQSPAAAIAQLQRRADDFLAALATAGRESEDAYRAQQQRLAGFVAAATHRVLEIAGVLANIKARIRSGEHSQSGKRDRLRAAGLDGEELDRAAAPFDATALNAEHAELVAEQGALERFLRSRDKNDLPQGFEVSA